MSGPSKIVQFSLEQGGAIVALDSNGNLWRGEIDRGSVGPANYQYAGMASWVGQSSTYQTALSSALGQANQQQPTYTPGTGKVKWVRISE